MITNGKLDIDIYKRRIKITVVAEYINNIGMNDWMIQYYYINYHNRFWRWYFKKYVIKRLQELCDEVGLNLKEIRNFSILNGDTKTSIIEQTAIIDFGTTKGIT